VLQKDYQIFWKENRIIDLHNDLLSYLVASPSHTPYDRATRSSISQLRKGGVGFLALVAFAQTERDSQYQLGRQVAAYLSLLQRYPEAFCQFPAQVKGRVSTCFAIENCSTCIGENEPIERGLKRLKKIFVAGVRPLYASLTWNQENRCGGGAHSSVGLKSDGERILDAIQGHVTAVDVSHASDLLAYDILSYLDRTKSTLKVMASHSSFRHVSNVPRNLPDEIAQEICHRGGVVGLTCIRNFIGKTAEDYYRHVEHGIALGITGALCVGADFFCVPGLPPKVLKAFYQEHFFPEIPNISALRTVLHGVGKRFGRDVQEGMAWKNAWERILTYK
jgi:microsomal dipeptidase-like Zn-dependent dipeptidase